MKREYIAIYEQGEDGWIVATVPEVHGAVSQGRTMEEARFMIADAVRLLLLLRLEQAAREASPDAIWETLTVEVDLDKYLERGK
ncbi:MAG: type II toxin-antitoxin system HicB family antitoxin [Anaerolineae bacterium]|nr:type II toxin-antitoxin system HicB family antitoxin [Anaerolineae bacterium]